MTKTLTVPSEMQTAARPQLTETMLDALREIGNIGAGNAMTSLSMMVDARIDMSIPDVGVVPLSAFTSMAGREEAVSVGIYMPVEGDVPGHIAILLPEAGAMRLVDQLMCQPPETTTALGAMECSALMEVGNIFISSYLVAIGGMTGLNLVASPPAMALDMSAAILSMLASAVAQLDDDVLTIVSKIDERLQGVDGVFIFVPEPGSLSILLRALQIEG